MPSFWSTGYVTVDSDESLNLELHCRNFENLDSAKFFTNFRFSNIWTLQNIFKNLEFCRTKV